MAETDDFVEDVLPRLDAAEIALHQGDARPRQEMWSRQDPVTLFGAEVDRAGRQELDPAFDCEVSDGR